MGRTTIAILGTILALGCRSATPRSDIDARVALRVAVARAEAVRDVDALLAMPRDPIALRGLGRVGGERAIAALLVALGDADTRDAAASALGVAASLDELAPETLATIGAALAKAPRSPHTVEALGRAGTRAELPRLVATTGEPAVRAAAVIAIGRYGRRKLAIDGLARGVLISVANDRDVVVRRAVAWAFAREHEPPADEVVTQALRRMLRDDDAEVRALAASAFARREIAEVAAITPLLADPDWRVRVEAVRALGATDALVTSLAALLADPSPHVALVALQLVATAKDQDLVARAAAAIAGSPAPRDASIGARWIACWRGQLVMRAGGTSSTCDLPPHFAAQAIGEVIPLLDDDVWEAHAARLVAAADPRVRAVGVSVTDDVEVVRAALLAPEPILVGAALQAIRDKALDVDTAVVERAARETDVELAADLLALIGERKIVAGAGACRGALATHPVRAAAGRACLTKLGVAIPEVAPATPTPPPVDVTSVIGKRVTWTLATSTGSIVIELDPDTAPWAVASIVALTRAGKYDGIAVHRVVPDFVVQGGDPTETGSGGPGYLLPAEPGTSLDGPGYVTGGVGIADAGRDSGGSQWFVMHAGAPHLDGRYTWVGHVASGQNHADGLQIGDTIVTATIEISGR